MTASIDATWISIARDWEMANDNANSKAIHFVLTELNKFRVVSDLKPLKFQKVLCFFCSSLRSCVAIHWQRVCVTCNKCQKWFSFWVFHFSHSLPEHCSVSNPYIIRCNSITVYFVSTLLFSLLYFVIVVTSLSMRSKVTNHLWTPDQRRRRRKETKSKKQKFIRWIES